MSSCKECGFELTEDSNFCPNCGEQILQGSETRPALVQDEIEPSVIICSGCGQENEVDAKFCMACSALLQKQPLEDKPTVCSACGEENPLGSDFCGGCGAALGRHVAIAETDITDPSFIQYLDGLDSRMKTAGFHIDSEAAKELGSSRVYRRTGIKLGAMWGMKSGTMGGNVDAYWVIKWQPSGLDADTLRAFASGIFGQLEKRKNIILKSLQPLAVYPVVVTHNAGIDMDAFFSSYCTPHLGAVEFPVVVQLDTGKVLYNMGNPIWGGVFFRNARKMADSLLVPVENTSQG